MVVRARISWVAALVVAGALASVLPAAAQTGLRFNGTNQFVTFGAATGTLGATQFTLEVWVRRTGTGASVGTGTGGLTAAVPLVTKGRGEGETPANVNMNYFMGINTNATQGTVGVLCADFEDTAGGGNHPVLGVTPIPADGAWHHAAATYDGTTWRLYLDGVLDRTLAANATPEATSIQHAGLGTAMTSAGVSGASGYFAGDLDEARIWSVARSQCEIATSMNLELTSGTGLIGRWGLNDGSGTSAVNSIGGSPAGTLTNGPTWVTGSPFDAALPPPPADPTGLAVSAPNPNQALLSWTDAATGESGYEVERSTAGAGGPFSLLASLAANSTSHSDYSALPGMAYWYRVRATGSCGNSGYSGVETATTPAEPCNALAFGPTSNGGYVALGQAPQLGASTFTLETWFRRTGTGVGTNTGSGGLNPIIPLVTKGMAEADGSTADMNYFLGIHTGGASPVLAADFEEGTGQASPGLNHPVQGVTPIVTGTWYHAAATFDGTTYRLYLNGLLEASVAVGAGRLPQSASLQHAALASALGTGGTVPSGQTAGFFAGQLDEARIWNVARTPAQIQATINSQLDTPQTGLIGRWGMNEITGSTVIGTAGTVTHGTLVGTQPAQWDRVACAPFDISFPSPPDAPSGLSASATTHSQVTLTWTDNSTTETGFEIERSTTGIGGTYVPLLTLAANSTSYSNGGLTASTEYCYRVRAVNGSGASAYDGPVCATTPAFSNTALSFSGSTAAPSYAGFGNPASLQLTSFTIEMWLRRDGAGEGTNTGSGGIADAIPLVAKGRAETETAATDINYLFGIRAATGALCADFEEGAGGSSPSLNHPIEGATSLALGTWYHAAATYDGVTWKLYLNGTLDASLPVLQPVASASTVPVALGSALTSASAAAGFFNGTLDEVRIWNVARTQSEIQATANAKIAVATPGLVARWSLDEGSGTVVGASAGTTVNGAISGPNVAWTSPGAPFDLLFNQQPPEPVLVAPANGATGVPTSPSLEVTVSDPEGGDLTVTYYGRPTGGSPGPDFTLIGLPDTQYYTGQLNGGTAAIFDAQTSWMVAQRAARNIVYMGGLGDCVEHGDNGGNDIEWQRANTSLSLLENAGTTGLPEGIPYGVTVGNHDQSPIGDADGTTNFYNQYFGVARFTGRTYYGGHYGANNDNWYQFFSASGLDFIVISLEYDTSPDPAVLSWADNLLTTYSNRRGIILSHFIINTGNPGGFGPQGQAIYDALKSHANLDLMLCGHVPGEGRRQDTFGGNTVYSLLADYQGRTAGGNGWLRVLEFSPANNEIRVRTYSPWLDQYETDGDSQFTLSYEMNSSPPFAAIGTVNGVPSGTNSSQVWAGLSPNSSYEWYATVSDGNVTTVGPTWSFTTGAGADFTITATAGPNGSIAPSGAVVVASGVDQAFAFTPDAGYHVSALSVDSAPVALAPSYEFTHVTANHTIDVQFDVNPAVAPVADLAAAPVSPGTPGEHTTPIQLTWTATPGGTTVEVWRKGFGGYPEYDDAGGAVPTASASYPPGAGWEQAAGVTASGSNDLTATRDDYYYVAYARDGYGTWSPVSNMTTGTLNYHLGDVSDGVTPGVGNNTVWSEDVSRLGAFYGASGAAVAPVNDLDVGPTTNQWVDGRPTTDNEIEFEDLVIFAIQYGLGHAGPGPALVARTLLAASSSVDELRLEGPSHVLPGEPVAADLRLRGSGTMIALSATLTWDAAVVQPIGQSAGAWLSAQEGQVFSPAPGRLDAAVMGGQGMAGEGVLASVRFRVLAAGDPKFGIVSAAGRDARNQPLLVETGSQLPVPRAPLTTGLASARPNPAPESVTLSFDLSARGVVELAIYGVDGRKMRTLVHGELEPGAYERVWDGRDDHGKASGAGVYYVRLVTPSGNFTRRLTTLK